MGISEDTIMLSGKYPCIFDRLKIVLRGNASRTEFKEKSDDQDYLIYLEVEYFLYANCITTLVLDSGS
jgi:hypothetical protein